MPYPGIPESMTQKMDDCVKEVMGKGHDKESAIAICHDSLMNGKALLDAMKDYMQKDTLVAFGSEIKALDDKGKVGGMLIRFTKSGDYDATGERFAEDTDYGDADKSDVYYHHGMDKTLGKKRLGKSPLTKKSDGIWIEHQLNLADEYENAIWELAKAGKLAWSSGTAAHLVDREQEDKGVKIKRWPLGLDASMTPTAAEYRNRVIPIKSLPEFDLQAEPEAVKTAAQAKVKLTNSTTQITQENKNMDPNELKALQDRLAAVEAEPLTVDQKKALKSMLDKFATLETEHAAMKEAMKKEPPKGSGIQVAPDQKYPYKAFAKDKQGRIVDGSGYGEFLQDVAKADSGTRSVSDRLGNWHEMNTKAMKATGLNVAIPSQGGFFVQTDHSQELIRNVFQTGSILARVRKIPLGPNADSITLNGVDETSRASTIWGGIVAYWIAEAVAATNSKPKFREIKLEVRGLGAKYYATDKLLRTAPALGALAGEGFREAMAFKVEDAIINGDGAGRPLGLMAATLTTTNGSTISISKETGQAAKTILTTNLSNMWARLLSGSKPNAIWLINTDCNPQLDELSLPAGTGALEPRFVNYGPDGLLRIKGKPVIEVEHCQTLGTTGDIILWDPNAYLFCDLGGVEEASSIHVAFETAETVFRYLYYCDGQPLTAKDLTPAHGTNTLSTQLILATRA